MDAPRQKALLVIGRMKQGKSAFCNSLICPRGGYLTQEIKEEMLIESPYLRNKAGQCYKRRVHPSHLLQNLFVIKTPGIGSHISPFQISEQIDNMIQEFRLDIIGIVYVIDLKVRFIREDDLSNIEKLLKLLKINRQKKKLCIFFLISKYDEMISSRSVSARNEIDVQFNRLLQKLNIPGYKSKLIKWINQRSAKQFPSFQYFYNHPEIQNILNQQYDKLRECIMGSSQYRISYEQHTQNVQSFWNAFVEKIQEQNMKNNIHYKQTPERINLTYKIYLQKFCLLKRIKQAFEKMKDQFLVNFQEILKSLYTKMFQPNKGFITNHENKSKIQQQRSSQFQYFVQARLLKCLVKIFSSRFIQFGQNNSIKIKNGIQKYIRLQKLSISFCYNIQSNQKTVLPFVSFLKQDLDEMNQDYILTLSPKIIEQAIIKEKYQKIRNQRQNFDEKVKKMRIPENIKIYLSKNNLEGQFIISPSIYLLECTNYFDLVNQVCSKMFN